jgi:hypothetical protein
MTLRPAGLNKAIACLFMVGSALFLLGSVPAYVNAVGATADNVTAFSVLLVAIFHASFDGAINQLSYDVVPASNTVRFLIFSA